MPPLIQALSTPLSPEDLVKSLGTAPHVVLLRSVIPDSLHGRYSFVAARPFLTFTAVGPRCELISGGASRIQFGNPWHLLDALMARYELLDEMDLPFPLGGCFGYWGYELKNFVEPKLARHATNDLEWPDCHVGFYDSLVAFDHWLGKTWIISTGLRVDGSRDEQYGRTQLAFWEQKLTAGTESPGEPSIFEAEVWSANPPRITSNLSRADFISAVERAQRYIWAGDIYQVNLSHRLSADWPFPGWDFFRRLSAVSPAPFSAYLDCGEFQIASSSPELFLRLSGAHVLTRPIKGTRPRSADPNRDAQLTYELQTSAKEMAELVMITDLLRNDLGRVCEYGSVQVPELVRLERYAHVQHLVSTIEGRLRSDVTHFAAFASCFPGGSITGAPKIRAMEIIDELEPITRGPYTGALGYLGFNRESQLSIVIRAGFKRSGAVHFPVGAGIVADSNPSAEYEETIAKALGFFSALAVPWLGGALDSGRAGSHERARRLGSQVHGKAALPKSMKVLLNGSLVPEEQALVSVFDRGFLYGDGLFETIALHNGKPFRWPQHFARLARGAEFLQMSIPCSSSELLRQANDLVTANEMPAGLLRITVSRGVGVRGYSPKGADRPTLVMTTHPSNDIAASAPRQWHLIISSFRVPAREPLATFKTCNKLPQILARAEAESRGANEALLLNTNGELAEAASSNLFWIEGETVCTTLLSTGILAGVMRECVLELCRSLRIRVEEKSARPKTLHQATGVFLTMSSLGIVEVTALDGRLVASSNLVQRLYDGYREALFKETA